MDERCSYKYVIITFLIPIFLTASKVDIDKDLKQASMGYEDFVPF